MFTASPLLAALPALPVALGPEVALPAIVLGTLGAVALFFARRKSRPSRLVQIVETASLGPKRSLIVARIGEETLILGSSEAGIALLGTKRGLAATEPAPAPAPVARPATAAPGILGRLRLQKSRVPVPKFEPLLRESLEDQELRAKVAAGHRGTVA